MYTNMHTVINCYPELPSPNPIFACVEHRIITMYFIDANFFCFNIPTLCKGGGVIGSIDSVWNTYL